MTKFVYDIDFESEQDRDNWDVRCSNCRTVFWSLDATDALLYTHYWNFCPICGQKIDEDASVYFAEVNKLRKG